MSDTLGHSFCSTVSEVLQGTVLGTESTKMSEVCPCDDDREEMEVNRNHYNSLKRTKIEVETSCWPSAHSERCACTMDIYMVLTGHLICLSTNGFFSPSLGSSVYCGCVA